MTEKNAQDASYADFIDYDAMFTDLAQQGILFTEENKKRFRTICGEELRKHDGNNPIGTSAGSSLVDFINTVFAFVRNIFKTDGNFSFDKIGDHLSGTFDRTSEESRLHSLHGATMGIYNRFMDEGGSFARAAELVTGQHQVNGNDNGTAPDMGTSVFHQVAQGARLTKNGQSIG